MLNFRGVALFFPTHPAKKLKNTKPKQFRKLELQNNPTKILVSLGIGRGAREFPYPSPKRLSPRKTNDWNLTITPKPKRKKSLKKKTPPFWASKCYFSGGPYCFSARVGTNLRLSTYFPHPEGSGPFLKIQRLKAIYHMFRCRRPWTMGPTADFGGDNRPYHL